MRRGERKVGVSYGTESKYMHEKRSKYFSKHYRRDMLP